jgi:hypothetical protein
LYDKSVKFTDKRGSTFRPFRGSAADIFKRIQLPTTPSAGITAIVTYFCRDVPPASTVTGDAEDIRFGTVARDGVPDGGLPAWLRQCSRDECLTARSVHIAVLAPRFRFIMRNWVIHFRLSRFSRIIPGYYDFSRMPAAKIPACRRDFVVQIENNLLILLYILASTAGAARFLREFSRRKREITAPELI